MLYIWLALIILGVMLEIVFILKESEGRLGVATFFKGLASLMFVALGIFNYMEVVSYNIGIPIIIGLILGIIGDVLLNLRFMLKKEASTIIFGIGITVFLAGHLMYIIALIASSAEIIIMALVLTAILSAIAIPTQLKLLTIKSKGIKTVGVIYYVVVIAMFCTAISFPIINGISLFSCVFILGALLFLISDTLMIYYTFGKKTRFLRVANLMLYYIAQVMIAMSIVAYSVSYVIYEIRF